MPQGSHNSLVTSEGCSRGRGSPPAPQPLLWGGHPRASWYLLDFLGEVLGDDPSFHLLLLVFAWREENTPRHHLARRLFFFPNKQQQNPTGNFQSGCSPSPVQTLPCREGSGTLSHVGTQHTHFSSESLGSRRLRLKKTSPDVIKLLELAASVLVPLPSLCSLPLHCQAGVPVPGAS